MDSLLSKFMEVGTTRYDCRQTYRSGVTVSDVLGAADRPLIVSWLLEKSLAVDLDSLTSICKLF